MRGNRFLTACSLFQFALFIPVAWWARKHPQPVRELAMTHAMQRKRSSFLQKTVQTLSTITGSNLTISVLAISTALLLWKQSKRLEAVFTIGISLSNMLMRTLIKEVVHRPRPSSALVTMSDHKKTKSFPSGHVCASVDFWGWLIALGFLQGTAPRHKLLTGLALLCLLYVGPSRVYLGDHWCTDVLGGYLFSGGWLALSLELYLRLRTKLAISGCKVSEQKKLD